jgi:hypothetical protein
LHIRATAFHIALSDPAPFHVVLAIAAKDLAILRGQEDSPEEILHRGLALRSVNQHLRRWGSDGSFSGIAGVILLAGREVNHLIPIT